MGYFSTWPRTSLFHDSQGILVFQMLWHACNCGKICSTYFQALLPIKWNVSCYELTTQQCCVKIIFMVHSSHSSSIGWFNNEYFSLSKLIRAIVLEISREKSWNLKQLFNLGVKFDWCMLSYYWGIGHLCKNAWSLSDDCLFVIVIEQDYVFFHLA